MAEGGGIAERWKEGGREGGREDAERRHEDQTREQGELQNEVIVKKPRMNQQPWAGSKEGSRRGREGEEGQ
eukprot:320316-Hanusia_phi.AAC.3